MRLLLKTFSLLFFVAISVLTACQRNARSDADTHQKVSFNYDIKPILSDRCFACHGPDANKREADLRLDTPEGAFAALTDKPAHFVIIAGDADESEVYRRITSTDPEVMMPPPESNLSLTQEEIALIRQWIEEGAEYEPHWSFIKPEKAAVPEVQNADWPKNEIDYFVLDKMEGQQWQPASKAEKSTLYRRLSFDLTGLPPSVEDLKKFLEDDSPQAYEQAVDKLLASQHYGERMASEWLDVARYADSHGYQDDGMRNMWPWRDWVIKAFNQNLPYDDFILWQLAGDLLPDPTEEQMLATGFNRNHLQSQEGGIVDEEYRVEYVADRTNTLGKAFLGLTLECARCHDHKYDPITQKEYYELYAFFNNVNEAGQIPYMGEASPTLVLTSDEAAQQLAFVEKKISELEKEVSPQKQSYQQDFEKWKASLNEKPAITLSKAIGHYTLDQPLENKFPNLANRTKPANMVVNQQDQEPEIVEAKFGKGLKLLGDSYVDMGEEIGYFDRHQPFSISLWFQTLEDSLDGPIFSRSGGLFNGNRGYDFMLRTDGTISVSLNHTYPANGIEVHTKDKLSPHQWHHLVLTYDGSSKASGVKIYKDGQALALTTINDHLEQSMIRYGKERESWGGTGNLQIGKRFEETLDGAVVDEFILFDKKLTAPEVSKLYDASAHLQNFLVADQQENLMDYYLENFNKDYRKHLKSLTEERGKENDILTDQPEVMVMLERAHPRKSFILERGAYDAYGEEVSANTPEVVMPIPKDVPKNRLGLAQWLIHEDHPLTARVVVNRYWQMLFGRGLVNTSDDYGNQGELPSHPELLDWLAVEFRQSGWDVKALLKTMVMSATYQQSSLADEEKMEMDPENVWLARGPSYRMPAEMIRDNALAVSGLLHDTIGGPSVKPYQPEGLWEELATRNAVTYEQDSGSKLYRRGLYTIWKRSTPPPSMISFDASEKYLCVVKRQKTSTPLQALILLNDPQYVEASRLLAERMLQEGGEKTENQIAYGFQALTSRQPDPRELELLTNLYEEELEVFKADPVSADSLLQVGEYPRNQQLAKAELAALTVVANTLVNYDEAVFKR